jgi:hypothetical protein
MSKQMKLTPEERELLVEVLLSQGWTSLLRAIDIEVGRLEQLLVKYDLSEGAEKLVHAKARVEGAHKLRYAINQMKSRYLKEEADDLANGDGH